MDVAGLVFTICLSLVALGFVQRVRGSRAGSGSGWDMTTSLGADQVEAIVIRGLKGMNPLARVRGGLGEGGLRRKIRRWAYQASSSAVVVVDVRPDDDSAERLIVSAGIAEWEIESYYGMAHPLMCAPLAARRRLRAIRKHLVMAERTPTAVADPQASVRALGPTHSSPVAGVAALAGGSVLYLEERRSPRAEQAAHDGRPVPAHVYDALKRRGLRSTESGRGWLMSGVPGIRHMAARPGGEMLAFVTCQAPPEPYVAGREVRLGSVPGYRVLDGRGAGGCGLEFSPDGRAIAYIEFCGGTEGALVVLNPASGGRTFLTRIKGITGSERPRWSRDGRFILVGTYPRPQLVAIADRTIGALAFDPRCDWWPHAGASMLLGVTGRHPDQRLASYRLEDGRASDLGLLSLPHEAELSRERQMVSGVSVAPDGRSLLLGMPHGPAAAYQDEHGSRTRIAFTSIADRQPRTAASPFLDEAGWIEREQSAWAWVHPAEPVGVSVEIGAAVRRAQQRWVADDPCAAYDPSRRDETVVVCDLRRLTSASAQLTWPVAYDGIAEARPRGRV